MPEWRELCASRKPGGLISKARSSLTGDKRRPHRAGMIATMLSALVCTLLIGQQATPPPVAPMIEIATSVTHHSINLPSGSVTYTATAAQLPLKSDTGEVECRMFYVAYSKDGADP